MHITSPSPFFQWLFGLTSLVNFVLAIVLLIGEMVMKQELDDVEDEMEERL